MIFKELHAVVFPTSDMSRSVRWWRDVLGSAPRESNDVVSVFGLGGSANLCLYRPEPEETKIARCLWRVDSAAKAHSVLRDKAACSEIERQGSVKFFRCFDPDGARFDVCEFDAHRRK